MRLCIFLVVLACLSVGCESGIVDFFKKIKQGFQKLGEHIKKAFEKVRNFFKDFHDMLRRMVGWRKAYPVQSKHIVTSDYTVDGDRFLKGMDISSKSTRFILTSVEGMVLASTGLGEEYGRILRGLQLGPEAKQALIKVLDKMLAIGNKLSRRVITFRGKSFNTRTVIKEEEIVVHLTNYMKGKTSNMPLATLKREVAGVPSSLSSIKSFLKGVASKFGNQLVFAQEKEVIHSFLFIYYRSVFIFNIKRVLSSKDGLRNAEDFEKESDFLEGIEKIIKLKETPPKKNPTEHSGAKTTGTIEVSIDGVKTVVTLKNANKYSQSQTKAMKAAIIELKEQLDKNDIPNLAVVNTETQKIRVKVHIVLTIYRFIRMQQKSVMSTYNEMKKTIHEIFDYLGDVLREEMQSIEPPNDVLNRVGPAIDSVMTLLPKLRAAYTNNEDDKKAYVEDYHKIFQDAAITLDAEIKRLDAAKKASNGKLMKVLALCRVLGRIHRSSYCVFSDKCKDV